MQLQNEINKVNNAIAAAKEGKRPSKKIAIEISDDEDEDAMDLGGGGDNGNDGGNNSKKKQYKAELIPALHYKPDLAK